MNIPNKIVRNILGDKVSKNQIMTKKNWPKCSYCGRSLYMNTDKTLFCANNNCPNYNVLLEMTN